MVTFTVISIDEIPGQTSDASDIEQWCESIAATECAKHKLAVPVMVFRYSRERKARYYYRFAPSEETAALYRERHGDEYREQWRKSYCETHEDDDMCQPDRYIRFRNWNSTGPAHTGSSGRAWSKYTYLKGWPGRIVCTFGTDPIDRKLTFLHELAHILVGTEHDHDRKFWRQAFDLFDAYGIPKDVYIDRSERYIKLAGKVAAQTGRKEVE